MRTILTASALTLAVAVAAGSTDAVAGSCNTKGAHAHAEHADASATPAIYPLAEKAGFSTLTAAVRAAGLEQTLTESGPFTVFAPTDEAFAKLPEGTVEALLAEPEKLKKVLLYHVVSGDVRAADVAKLSSAETLNGTRVAIATGDGVTVNDAKVVQADIEAANGVVHVIDTVLIPENL